MARRMGGIRRMATARETAPRRKTAAEEVVAALQREQRIMLIDGKMGFKSTSHIIDWARWKGRPRNDVYEACIWKESVTVVDDNELYLFLGVQQESIVVPENVDAIRAIMGTASQTESVSLTNSTLGISEPPK